MKTLLPVRIERMREQDIPRVLQIERASFPTPWPPEAYRREIRENRTAHYIVARVGEEVVGYAGMWVILEEAHITTIAVDPKWRGRRVGERLLVALIEEARNRGARWVTLEVRKSNHIAQNLYRKYGFREVHVRKGYYTDNGEDALIMWTGNILEEPFRSRFEALKAQLQPREGEP
ncbi:MAG: ribosomal protein S18-alanine N-acetyltransferase [Armatimonadota bacterium]|nr:ribosomal protein S18-alanine N-acetyltransferase [Armatimonadota bacterium]MDR7444222.1 ribosomal protein S18-alanine N-acetyltransferase [Armatimonadota bacterium]MDR7570531.1 ribosomal protein S18-alanine N-acetyltransferase [Armatimonadota bacterium]MDR7614243.1 ribosomal protein S18-alanine N-acetyltransferase [Armatimonadota bacterium]